MKKKVLTFSLALLFLLFASSLRAEERIVVQNEDLTILLDEADSSPAEHLQRIYARTKADIEHALGWKLLSKPIVVLVADKEAFERMSGSPYVAGYAVPERHLIVMSLARVGSEPYFFNVTFKHELCHLLLHDHIQDSLLPRWLDEGICQWVSGSLGEILLGNDTSAVTRIDLSLHAIPLRQLTTSFPQGKYPLLLAYYESRSFVEYLSSRYGSEALLGILNHLREGEGIDRAFIKSLSKSLDAVEKEWIESVRTRNVWLIWISQYLYEILFAAGALLMVAAFLKLMLRKRRYLEEEEEDVEGPQSPTSEH